VTSVVAPEPAVEMSQGKSGVLRELLDFFLKKNDFGKEQLTELTKCRLGKFFCRAEIRVASFFCGKRKQSFRGEEVLIAIPSYREGRSCVQTYIYQRAADFKSVSWASGANRLLGIDKAVG
jgi:hypothetical protein